MVSNKSIRRCVLKFGPMIAKNLRNSGSQVYTRWHLDEMVISLSGKQRYMWLAVDGEGEVPEILVEPQRDKAAALGLLGKLLRRQGFVPAVIVTESCDLLRIGPPRNWLLGFARARSARQQPHGELTSDHWTARAKDARLQIGSVLRFGPCRGHVQCPAAFDQPSDPSTVSNRSASISEQGYSCGVITRLILRVSRLLMCQRRTQQSRYSE
jgi:DDE superfamily endonuclease